MKVQAIYPVIAVDNPSLTAKAFRELLQLTIVFETDWYIHLKGENEEAQIGVVKYNHSSVPDKFRTAVKGMFVTIEPESVVQLWETSKGRFDVIVPLTEEDWGQRHFILKLPGEVLADFVEFMT